MGWKPPKKDAALCVVLHTLAVREEGPGTEGRCGCNRPALCGCADAPLLVAVAPLTACGHTSHKTAAGWTQEQVWPSEVQQALTEHSLRPGCRPSGGQGLSSLPEVLEHQVLKLPQPMDKETEAREATFLQASSQACGNENREHLWNMCPRTAGQAPRLTWPRAV